MMYFMQVVKCIKACRYLYPIYYEGTTHCNFALLNSCKEKFN